MKIAYFFIAVICFFGAGLIAFDDFNREQKSSSFWARQSMATYEVWTDEKTGHRFVVAMCKHYDGIGICLIPDFKKEDDEEHFEVPHPRIIESTAGWKENQ